MQYEWIGPGVLGGGRNAILPGDILPGRYKKRIVEFLSAGKIKEIPEKSEKDPEEEIKPKPKAAPKKRTAAKKKATSKKGNKKS